MPSLRALALLLALAFPALAFCQEMAMPPPEKPAWGIIEEYDEVVLVHIVETYHYEDESRTPYQYQSTRLYFGRKGKIIADRYYSGEFQFTQVDGHWIVFWRESWISGIDRLIITKSLAELHIERDTDDKLPAQDWWGMGNRMTDLEPPPEEP